MLYIPEVEFKLALPREAIATVDLGPARDARARFVATRLLRRVPLQINGGEGAGADEAHFTTQDVPEFRQLVQAGGPQKLPPCSQALGVGTRRHCAWCAA